MGEKKDGLAKDLDPEVTKKIQELEAQYEYNWGKKPDRTVRPSRMSREDYVKVLEHIVETGESIIVGWDAVKNELGK